MNYILAFALIVVVILLTTNMESFTETFGLSGYTKPVPPVKLNDPRPNLEGFEPFEVSVDNNMVEDFVLQANKEISKRTVCARTSSRPPPSRGTGRITPRFMRSCSWP